jgi:hypothetical protein
VSPSTLFKEQTCAQIHQSIRSLRAGDFGASRERSPMLISVERAREVRDLFPFRVAAGNLPK